MAEERLNRVALFAAGSLHAALGQIAVAFEDTNGVEIDATFGSSGILRERIEAGEHPDVFASADMGHPTSLMLARRAGPVVVFARTRVCALVREDTTVEPHRLLEYLLDPAIRIGTGTPGGDPLGDYTWQVFKRAEEVQGGSFESLSQKARPLFGGRERALPVPEGRHPIIYFLAESRDVDIFFVYCANVGSILEAGPQLRLLSLPPELAVPANFGLAVLSQGSTEANRLAFTILSPIGQMIMARHGFEAPLEVREPS